MRFFHTAQSVGRIVKLVGNMKPMRGKISNSLRENQIRVIELPPKFLSDGLSHFDERRALAALARVFEFTPQL